MSGQDTRRDFLAGRALLQLDTRRKLWRTKSRRTRSRRTKAGADNKLTKTGGGYLFNVSGQPSHLDSR